MQVQKEVRELEMTGFENNDAKQFTIEATPEAFEILSSGVYTDKPLAVIRELSCNAYDAHVDAGTGDKPFEVHLPNHFEPFFSIRDFGKGLSHDDVMNLYTTYFKSTKKQDNNAIGCMGIGSKSPFAYVDQFTVTSYFGGVKSVYMVYINDENMPSIMLTGSEPTTEETGLEIHMMANQSDFSTFADRARRFYHRFPVHPIIKGNSSVDLTKVKYTMEGPNYKLRSNDEHLSYADHKGAYAIQGVVAYPIKVDKIRIAMTDRQKELLQSMAIDIIFPIGQLGVAASREELSYTKITQQNIVDAVKAIEAHVPQHAAKVLADAKNEFEARVLYQRWLGEGSVEARFMAKVLGRKLNWSGKEISDGKLPIYMYDRTQVEAVKTTTTASLDTDTVKTLIDLHKIDEYGDITHFSEYDLRSHRTKKLTGSHVKSFEVSAGDISGKDPEQVVVIVDDEKLNKGLARLIQHNYLDKEVAVLVIRPIVGFEQQVKDQFKGFDAFIPASTLDTPPPEVKVAKTVSDVRKLLKVRKIHEGYYSNNVETNDTDYDVVNGGTYMVLFNKGLVTPGQEWLEKGNEPETDKGPVLSLLRESVRLGLINLDKDNIYAFNSTHKHLVNKHKNWISVWELIKQRIEAKLADKDYIKNIENFYLFQALYENLDSGTHQIARMNKPLEAAVQKVVSPSSKFKKHFAEVTQITQTFDDFMFTQGVETDRYLNLGLKKGYGSQKPIDLSSVTKLLQFSTEVLKTKNVETFKTKNVETFKTKAVAKATKMADDFKNRYPLLPHLINSHLDVATQSKGIALYINMCDKTQALVKAYAA